MKKYIRDTFVRNEKTPGKQIVGSQDIFTKCRYSLPDLSAIALLTLKDFNY